MLVLKLKTLEIDLLWAFMNWQPIGLFGRTINGYILLVDPSRKYHKVLFWSLSPLSSWMYVEFVDMNGKKNLHSQSFLKHDALWANECSSNLYLSNVSRTLLFPQNGSVSVKHPPFMWYEKVYAAMSNLSFDGPEGRSLYCLNLNCRAPPGRFFRSDLSFRWAILCTSSYVDSTRFGLFRMPPRARVMFST